MIGTSGSSYLNVLLTLAFQQEQAKKHFVSNGRNYTQGYLHARRRRWKWLERIFPDAEYRGAMDALKELSRS